MTRLTHVDETGAARMVDVGAKAATARIARAEGCILMPDTAIAAVRDGAAKKGDVLAVARVAAIMAAKRTSDLIPLCHPVALTAVTIDFDVSGDGIRVTAECRTTGQTGVEMEALSAVSAALLTIYDMTKAMSKSMRITDIRLLAKSGGASGDYTA